MVEIFLLQKWIDLGELILAVQTVLKVLHSFDFSLTVFELGAPRALHPYRTIGCVALCALSSGNLPRARSVHFC